LINVEEFKKKYKVFESIDQKNSPNTFSRFWKYKLGVENEHAHIIDRYHLTETLSKLMPTLKIWRWHRPYDFDYCSKLFQSAVEKISDSYTKIRNFSLLKLDEIPLSELKKIWDSLGTIEDRKYGKLVMKITKPLMFLWGQTPAFDTVVRANMPLINLRGFQNTRWNFNLWMDALKRLQVYLCQNAEVEECFRKMSIEKYGTDTVIPYGQFFDLYYWVKEKSCTDSLDENRSEVIIDGNKQREYGEFIQLINRLRKHNRLSAEEWREYRKQWEDNPQSRPLLFKQLQLIDSK
jgi:hypothetical protein